MSNLLYAFRNAVQAERLKLKGSKILLLCFILAIVFPVLHFFVRLIEATDAISSSQDRLSFNYFKDQFDAQLLAFGYFPFPLALIILAARVAGIEHKTDAWKLIETQPVGRLSIWLSKWIVTSVLAVLVVIIYGAATIALDGISLFVIDVHPAAKFGMPLGHILVALARLWIAGLGLLTIQLGLSIVLRSTLWPIMIGVAALIVNAIVGSNNITVSSFWPYSLTGYTARYPNASETGKFLLPSEWQGLAWVLLAPLAFWLYYNRASIKRIFRFNMMGVTSGICIFLLIAVSWFIQHPAKPKLLVDGRTVIAGRIFADSLPDSISIHSIPLDFTLGKSAVSQDGYFHADIKLLGDIEQIRLKAGNLFYNVVYAGKGDSVYVKWQQDLKIKQQKIEVYGTAISTNQYMRLAGEYGAVTRYYLERQDFQEPPRQFFQHMLVSWEEDIAKARKFRTADGYGLSDDMLLVTTKLITVNYLQMAYFQYPKKINIALDDPAFANALPLLKPMLALAGDFDSTLVGWTQYHDFLRKWLVKDLPPALDKDSAYLAILLQKHSTNTRDQLLYDFSLARLESSRDSATRSTVLADASHLEDKRYWDKLKEKSDQFNRLRKGKPVPYFDAENVDGKTVSFDNLAGRFVVVDVWASWCGPCREQSPVFEKIAGKYTNSPIVFLGLSADEDKQAWRNFLSSNKSGLMHWRITNPRAMNALYGIEFIPRFMLIDPNGNFINAKLPNPTEPNFELLIRQALGLEAQEG